MNELVLRPARTADSDSGSDTDLEFEPSCYSGEMMSPEPLVSAPSSSWEAGTKPRVCTLEEIRYLTHDFAKEAAILSQGEYEKFYLVQREKNPQMSAQVCYVKLFLGDGKQLPWDRFQNELHILLKLRGPHIPTLAGYTNETRHECTPCEGNRVSIQNIHGALYFEDQPRDSLKSFLLRKMLWSPSNEKKDWRRLHHIILQTCFGLRNLHDRQSPSVLHLDINPENIYVDKCSYGKVQFSGFGSSMFCDDEEIQIWMDSVGTPGYVPPEHAKNGIVSKKFDIFSLGVVIVEIVAGPEARSKSTEMSRQDFINTVLEAWTRWLKLKLYHGFELETMCQQVKICTEIALNCMQTDRYKRPEISSIIGYLTMFDMHQIQSCTLSVIANEETEERSGEAHREFNGQIDTTSRISVHPSELRFTLKEKEWISGPLSLINKKDYTVGFVILMDDYPHKYYCTDNLVTCVKPMSTRLVAVSMIGVPLSTEMFTILMIDNVPELVLAALQTPITDNPNNQSYLLDAIKKYNGTVHRAALTAHFDGETPMSTTLKIMPQEELGSVCSIDIHPSETLMLVAYERDYVSIINCQTQLQGAPCQPVYVTAKLNYHISTAKFIAQENWIVVASADDGYIRVYTCPTMKLVKKFKAADGKISSLAVDSTRPCLVSTSPNEEIKLWDWGQGWVSSKSYYGSRGTTGQVKFDPKDKGIACVGSQSLQFWSNMPSLWPTSKFTGACSFDYPFTVSDGRYIIAYFPSGIATICDLQTERVDHTFTLNTGDNNKLPVTACHPKLPLLVTCSDDGTICFWNTNTYRFEKSVRCVIGKLFYVGFISSKSVVIGCHDGIHILEIDLENIANQQDDRVTKLELQI